MSIWFSNAINASITIIDVFIRCYIVLTCFNFTIILTNFIISAIVVIRFIILIGLIGTNRQCLFRKRFGCIFWRGDGDRTHCS